MSTGDEVLTLPGNVIGWSPEGKQLITLWKGSVAVWDPVSAWLKGQPREKGDILD
jgi:hypothetical protein